MKQSKVFSTGIFILSLFVVSGVWAATLEQLVEAAKKEGTIEFYAPSNLTPGGAQMLADAFNKMYGLKISVHYNPAGNMSRDVNKVVGTAPTGAPPEWDVMVVTDAHHATLAVRKLHETIDYKNLGIDPNIIHYNNGSISFVNQFILPAYNHKVVPAKDVPKGWDDLLDPKWKGGKLGMSTATHHLSRLAAGPWGEAKTTEYVRGLAGHQPFLGTPAEIYTRLQLGEVMVAVTMSDGFIHRAKIAGAPFAHAEGIEPLISPAFHAGVVKGARHPNAGHLLTVFLTTPKAQEIWEKYGGESSAFTRGTRAYTYAQGKQVVYMSDKSAALVDKLARDYARILGFR